MSETAFPVWLSAGAAIVGLGALLLLAAWALRRLVLSRGSGTLRCFLRTTSGARRGVWRPGWGRYGVQELEWYPTRSLRLRAAVRLPRRGLEIVGREAPDSPRLRRAGADAVVVDVAAPGNGGGVPREATHSLVMSERALTGFLSWVEAAPPGTRYHY